MNIRPDSQLPSDSNFEFEGLKKPANPRENWTGAIQKDPDSLPPSTSIFDLQAKPGPNDNAQDIKKYLESTIENTEAKIEKLENKIPELSEEKQEQANKLLNLLENKLAAAQEDLELVNQMANIESLSDEELMRLMRDLENEVKDATQDLTVTDIFQKTLRQIIGMMEGMPVPSNKVEIYNVIDHLASVRMDNLENRISLLEEGIAQIETELYSE